MKKSIGTYKAISLLLVLFFYLAAKAQTDSVSLGRNGVVCVYTKQSGRFTGPFTSFYPNGKLKSRGSLQNGYKAGRWQIWDNTGRLRMEREYKNPVSYNRIYPPEPVNGPAGLFFRNRDSLSYNPDHTIAYSKIAAEDAVYRHKNWRTVDSSGNAVLFSNQFFARLLLKMSAPDSVILYDTTDDRFTTPLTAAEKIKRLQALRQNMVQFTIKEELIFDMNRLVMEYRILGICPQLKTAAGLQSAGWFYFPQLRPAIALEQIRLPQENKIYTLDEFFFYRYFQSALIKTTLDNPYDRFLKDFPGMNAKIIELEREDLEIEFIEAETDLLLWLTK